MRPTLIHHTQLDILEKIGAGFTEDEIMTISEVFLEDDKTGEPIMGKDTGKQIKMKSGWTGKHVKESLVHMIETYVLADQLHVVNPINAGVALIPEYWSITLNSQDFVHFVINDPSQDKETIPTEFLDWLYGSDESGEELMWARAYNGQYGNVALRLLPYEFDMLKRNFNELLNSERKEEKIKKDGILHSPLIDKAYEHLKKEYKVKFSELYQNKTNLILAPLACEFLDRLKGSKVSQNRFVTELLSFREELKPVRQRFVEIQSIDDDPSKSPKEAEKVIAAIEADAKKFAKKWNRDKSDSTVIQYCLDNLSFLVKLIRKGKVEIEEVIEKVTKIAPGVARWFRSSSPTLLSKIAWKTRNMKNFERLIESNLSLRFNDD